MQTIFKLTAVATLVIAALSGEAQAFTLLQDGVRGWVAGEVTFDYDLSACTRSKAELLNQIDRAMALWNSVPTAHVHIHRGVEISGVNPAVLMTRVTPGNAIIACSTNFKADTGRDPAWTLAVGGAAVDEEGRIGFGYAILNSDSASSFTASDISDDEMIAVIAHEFGHSLGLGHSQYPDALMHAEATSLPSLSQDDVDAITSLYEHPPEADDGKKGLFGCASVAVVGSGGAGPKGGLGDVTLNFLRASLPNAMRRA